jgi:SNF2 family DNA or RNA helicase
MASENRVRDCQTTLMESLAKMGDEKDPDNMPPLDFTEAPSIEWKEGVEHLQDVSVDTLWEWLGDESKKLPFINTVHDPDGMRDPWLAEDKAWFADPKNTEPFGPKWHQLVGLYWLLERAFEGKNGLNMDEVGLGKTLQAASLIAKLTQMRACFKVKGRFPGKFCE